MLYLMQKFWWFNFITKSENVDDEESLDDEKLEEFQDMDINKYFKFIHNHKYFIDIFINLNFC